MTVATRPIRETITESISASARVDRDAGVIRNVKLIGFESKNGRIYPAKALKEAVHLYEGAKVNIDHPHNGDATSERSYGDRLGVIRGVRFVEGKGNFGDFHFNPKHPRAEQVIWDAENNPESLGFSHNATLRLGPIQNGKQVIESIVAIRSMDLVADPATTTSLFESENPAMDEPNMSTDNAPSDPKAAMKGAFRQMIMAAVDDESLDMRATLKKIGEIMKSQEKLMGGGSSAPAESEEQTETPEKEAVAFQKQIADLKQQLESYRAKEKQTAITESINAALSAAGLNPKNTAHVSELFSKQLLATESEDDRKALIADRAALLGAKPVTESHQPTYTPATTQATESIDAKSFANRLLS